MLLNDRNVSDTQMTSDDAFVFKDFLFVCERETLKPRCNNADLQKQFSTSANNFTESKRKKGMYQFTACYGATEFKNKTRTHLIGRKPMAEQCRTVHRWSVL